MLIANRVDYIISDIYIAKYKYRKLQQEEDEIRIIKQEIKCVYDLDSKPYRAIFKEKKVADLFNIGLKKILINNKYKMILEKYGLSANYWSPHN